MEQSIIILIAGLLAGAMNAVAGGGSFLTFSALVYAGVPSVTANASSTVALFPAGAVSVWEYRSIITPFEGIGMAGLIIVTVVGGFVGALLLLFTPSSSFDAIIPWLLLTGTVTFAFGKRIVALFGRKFRVNMFTIFIFQFILGIYGGYFGGAVSIMMMSIWTLFDLADIKLINANKTLLVCCANSAAVALFIIMGKVAWPQTFMMFGATVLGGYLGARYAMKVNPARLRLGINILNFSITAVFFIRIYFHVL